MRPSFFHVVLTAALALSSSGCIKKMLVTGQIASTRTASGALDTVGDLELVKAAAQAGIIQFEGLHRLAPDNTDGLFLLTKSWVSYGYGFVEDDLEAAADAGNDAAEESAHHRAGLAYDRAQAYGLELLGHHASGFESARKGAVPLRAWLNANFDSENDGIDLFWTGYAWLARTALNKDNPALVAELWIGVAMMERSRELAPTYNTFSSTVALASYHARSASAEMDEAKRMFEDALAKTGRKMLLVQLSYATRYACAKQDAAMYSKLLQEVVSAPEVVPNLRLLNAIAKRRAKRWLTEKRAFEACSIDLPAPSKK